MKRVHRKMLVWGVLGLFLTAAGCKKDSSEDKGATKDNPVETEPKQEENNPQTAVVGTLAISDQSTPGQIMALATASIASAMDGDAGNAVAGSVNLQTATLNLIEETQSDDPLCSVHGTPWALAGELADSSGALMTNAPLYAGRFFYCVTNYNTNSPESILGAFKLNGIIACIVDKAFPEGYPEVLTESKITIDFTKVGDCIDQAAADKMGPEMGVFELPLKAQKLGSDSPWNYFVSFEADGKSDMYFAASSERVSAMMIEYTNDDAGKAKGLWQFSLDNNAGGAVVRYEAFGLKNGDGSLDGTHLRLLLEGEVDSTTNAFTSLDRLEGLFSVGATPQGTYSPGVYSIKGDTESGFRVLNYYCPNGEMECDGGVASNIAVIQTACQPEAKTCDGLDGITFASETDLGFKKFYQFVSATELAFHPEMLAWVQSPKPITFNSVTTDMVPPSNVSLDQATDGQFTCNQTHEQNYSKNCSTLFSAASLEEAANLCKKSEADGGQGCCSSSSVFTKKFGPVVKYEVVSAGKKRGEGTTYQCD